MVTIVNDFILHIWKLLREWTFEKKSWYRYNFSKTLYNYLCIRVLGVYSSNCQKRLLLRTGVHPKGVWGVLSFSTVLLFDFVHVSTGWRLFIQKKVATIYHPSKCTITPFSCMGLPVLGRLLPFFTNSS